MLEAGRKGTWLLELSTYLLSKYLTWEGNKFLTRTLLGRIYILYLLDGTDGVHRDSTLVGLEVFILSDRLI